MGGIGLILLRDSHYRLQPPGQFARAAKGVFAKKKLERFMTAARTEG